MISPGAITRTEIQSDPTASPSTWNVENWPRGTISKRGGIDAKHPTARSTTVIKMYEWTDLTDIHHSMVFQSRADTTSAEIYALTTSTNASSYGTTNFTMILTGGTYNWVAVSGDDVIGCTTYAGSAIFVNGGATFIMSWSGNTTEAAVSATTTPIGATCCLGWGGYLFLGNVMVGSVRKQSRVQWNSVNSITTWPSTYWIDLDPDDGDYITGITLYGDQIIVFKENKIFSISWVGGQLLFNSVRRSSEIGCIAPDTIVQKNGLIYFLSKNGVYTFDGQSTRSASDKISDKITNELNPSTVQVSKAVVYDKHEQIWFAVPKSPSTLPNRVYVMDYITGGWNAYDMDIEGLANLTIATDQIYASYPLPYSSYSLEKIGEQTGEESSFLGIVSNGFVSEFGGVSTDLGSEFSAGWKSPWYDFGQAALNKRVLRITALVDTVEATGSSTLNISTFKDWDEETVRKTDTLELSASGNEAVREKRADFTEPCRAFKFTVSASSSAPVFSVHRLELDYIPKGRTLV